MAQDHTCVKLNGRVPQDTMAQDHTCVNLNGRVPQDVMARYHTCVNLIFCIAQALPSSRSRGVVGHTYPRWSP